MECPDVEPPFCSLRHWDSRLIAGRRILRILQTRLGNNPEACHEEGSRRQWRLSCTLLGFRAQSCFCIWP
jgi:hypothetical protein